MTATALQVFLLELGREPADVLLIGDRDGDEGAQIRAAGHNVVDVCYSRNGMLFEHIRPRGPQYDGIYCSHTLEHMRNPGDALDKMRVLLQADGVLGVVVPPMKREIVGGHVTLWNAGLLLYQLILAGFDCGQARVRTHAYDCAVIVRKREREPVTLAFDTGDITTLNRFFPFHVYEGFNGDLPAINWPD